MKKVLLNRLYSDKRFDNKGKCFFYYYRTMSVNDIKEAINGLGKGC